MKTKIGGVYLESRHYIDEANQTIGKPAIDGDVIVNRRNVTNKLTEEGKEILENVKKYFENVHGLEVKLSFSKYCGCSQCPCSPGYEIKAVVDPSANISRTKDEDRYSIFVNDDDTLDVRPPKNNDKLEYIKIINEAIKISK